MNRLGLPRQSGNQIFKDERGGRIDIVEPPTADDAKRLRASGIRDAWIKGFGMSDLPDLSILDGLVDELNVVTLNLRSDAAVESLPDLKGLKPAQSGRRGRLIRSRRP